MEKIWPYLAVYAFGIVSGMIILYFILRNSINSTVIRGTVKQKKTSGSNQHVTPNFNIGSQKGLKREQRRMDKALKRANKKLTKS
jgi:hypothetical protein